MRGRKPTPTTLKILRGNPGRRKLPKGEPKPKPAGREPPDHLSDPAKKEWHRMGAVLYPLGLLTELDVPAFELYCETYARWLEAKDKVAEKGTVLVTKNKNLIQNPYLSIANKAQEQMVKILACFGMEPSSRTRVTAEKPDEDKGEIEEMLFG